MIREALKVKVKLFVGKDEHEEANKYAEAVEINSFYYKRCRRCGGVVHVFATRCKHCGGPT